MVRVKRRNLVENLGQMGNGQVGGVEPSFCCPTRLFVEFMQVEVQFCVFSPLQRSLPPTRSVSENILFLSTRLQHFLSFLARGSCTL